MTIGGVQLRWERSQLRQLPDEVDPVSGKVARNWQVPAYFVTQTDADALRALASWNLRRTISWQLRGDGHGDVAVADLPGAGNVTVRFEVQGATHPAGTHQVLSLLLREQVVTP